MSDPLAPARGVLIGLVLGAILWFALLGIVYVARAIGDTDALRYRTADRRVIVVRGDDCMDEEDSSVLRLVDYVGSSKAIYRCVRP